MEAETIIEWGAKWTKIRDAAQTPQARAYAESYLDMLRRQLTKLREARR